MFERTLKNFTVTRDESGVCQIVLDVPGRPLNVLDAGVMKELNQIINELEISQGVKLVVFKSGKESGFLAGADIEAIEAIKKPEDADRLLAQGQSLFTRIENLPMTTLAVLHGPCLGGGLEWALACDYRIARDNSSTKIGLPEISLGLIPGWGGTQRLPELVGVKASLELILTGKHLSAGDALRVGLIDLAIAPDHWRDEVLRAIDRLVAGRPLAKKKWNRATFVRMIERLPMVRRLMLMAAIKKSSSQSANYPAIPAAIRAIADHDHAGVDGFSTERREFRALVNSPTSRQLLRLFFSRERARNLSTWAPASARVIHLPPIRKIGVIGAGAMGAGIAQVAAIRGFDVAIKEVDDEAARRGAARVGQLLSQYSRHKGWDEARSRQLRDSIRVGTEVSSLADADCVIEAVVERMDVKQAVLAATEQTLGHESVLVTNTSALSVTEMAKALKRPDKFAGLHFFNPVHRMELVEVVRGEKTSDTTIAHLVCLVRALGKTPIVTFDSPGFLVNRILFPYLGEAVLMVREGYAVEAIDREIRKFGMPMGPLELLDRVGLDVALHVAQTMRTVLCDADEVMEILAPLVQRNQVGLKSGRGFYDHRGKSIKPRETAEIVDFVVAPPSVPPGVATFAPDHMTEIQRRLIYPMLAEAIRCEDELVVEHSWAIDLAMVLGIGFAPHLGGPLSLIEQIGAPTVLANLERLRIQYGDRFVPPKKLLLGAE